MEDDVIKELASRQQEVLEGAERAYHGFDEITLRRLDEDAEIEALIERERALEEELRRLQTPAFDGTRIRVENALRRARGKLIEAEIAESLGVERVPWATKVWYDGYQAYVKVRLPNPLYRLCRVFKEDGEVLEEDAIVMVHLSAYENFWPRDYIYVEPSPTIRGKWQLVEGSKYNIKGVRIG